METTHYLYLARPPRPSFPHDATPREQALLGRHFTFMDKVREQGELLVTGPALDGTYGVAIFKVTTQERAEALAREDPAVQGGMFTWTVHPLALGPVTP